MQITKYEHACLVVEEQGKKLIIDPGAYSASLRNNLTNVLAVVITHSHQDHFDKARLDNIFNFNLTAKLFTVKTVADQLKGVPYAVEQVVAGSKATIGPFSLEFFGGQHALIHKSIPPTDNVGLMINDAFYYPGDSFTPPGKPVAILAVPASAPWMNIGQAMDFITEVHADRVFPTHNAILSGVGNEIHNRLLDMACQQANTRYEVLAPGESLDV